MKTKNVHESINATVNLFESTLLKYQTDFPDRSLEWIRVATRNNLRTNYPDLNTFEIAIAEHRFLKNQENKNGEEKV